MNWYYAEDNERRGPVDDAAFATLVSSGTIKPDTLVWNEGMTNWEPYSTVRASVAQAASVTAPVITAGRATGGGVVCSQCGQTFPPDEVITYEGRTVCAGCKPLFFQKVKEGALTSGVHEYAGFWIRFVAKFIDGIIMQIISVVINLALSMGGIAAETLVWVGMVLSLLINVAYAVYFVGRYGATPGKMACKLKVVRPDGSSLSYGRAAGRYFAELVSTLTLLIGYIMAAFDVEKRALHDRICDTRVIRAR